jgi:hypothetical protein
VKLTAYTGLEKTSETPVAQAQPGFPFVTLRQAVNGGAIQGLGAFPGSP